jgi:hypothetical protein
MAERGNHLSLRHDPKAVPYGGAGETREDGEANHGFKNLLRNPELLEAVPELASDDALRMLVVSLNRPEGGTFSIGCLSADITEHGQFRRTGYIEFAFNSVEAIADAQVYFPAFFHFDRLLLEQPPSLGVQFNWELRPASFWDVSIDGYTCSITINTHFFGAVTSARECWTNSLKLLQQLLQAIPPHLGTPIY